MNICFYYVLQSEDTSNRIELGVRVAKRRAGQMVEETLKYPRRKARTVGGVTYSLSPPDNKVSGRMRAVKKTKTSIEDLLRQSLCAVGLRFRKLEGIPGSPDFAVKKYKVAIFCDGDFWHGYKFDPTKIRNNSAFWAAKIQKNIERDHKVSAQLQTEGWKVFRFWEHKIREDALACATIVLDYIEGMRQHD